MEFTLSTERSCFSFKNTLKNMAEELAGTNKIAFQRGLNVIEIREITWIDRIWRFFGSSAYKKSQLKTIMKVYLDYNKKWALEEIDHENSILCADRIKFIPRSELNILYDHRHIVREIKIEDLKRKHISDYKELEVEKNQLVSDINKLESRKGQLIGQHLNDYNRLCTTIKNNYDSQKKIRDIAREELRQKLISDIERLEIRNGRLIDKHFEDYNKLCDKIKSDYENKVNSIPKLTSIQSNAVKILENLRKDTKSADIILVSSERKDIHAHSLFLRDIIYFTNVSRNKLDGNNQCIAKKIELEYSEFTINYYLDMKYGIKQEIKDMPLGHMLEMFYFANFIQDEEIENYVFNFLFGFFLGDKIAFPYMLEMVLTVSRPHDHLDNINLFQGKMLKTTDSIKKKWFNKLFQMKETNDAYIQNYLAFCYKNGIGVKLDMVEAMKWYKLSADQGLDWAQFNLGSISKNNEEKLKYLLMAHEQGVTGALSLIEQLNT